MQCATGKHCAFYHRYHLAWSTKYRYNVLRGDVKLRVRDICRQMKGRSSHKIQRAFPHLKKRYWGRHFGTVGYFSTLNGAITEDSVLQYLEKYIATPTDASR